MVPIAGFTRQNDSGTEQEQTGLSASSLKADPSIPIAATGMTAVVLARYAASFNHLPSDEGVAQGPGQKGLTTLDDQRPRSFDCINVEYSLLGGIF